jgi:AcrR family transcriptional regulator
MKTEIKHRTERMPASERRAEIIQAAMAEFAMKGLHGTSTEDIAARAGVSQPYLFRLFGTKKDLFLAAVEGCFGRVHDAFRLAVESEPEDALEAMGHAYKGLLERREMLLLQLHAYAACSDPEVGAAVRRQYGELYRYVKQISGEDDECLREFFAHGMLMTVAAAMNLPAVLKTEAWACELLGPFLHK